MIHSTNTILFTYSVSIQQLNTLHCWLVQLNRMEYCRGFSWSIPSSTTEIEIKSIDEISLGIDDIDIKQCNQYLYFDLNNIISFIVNVIFFIVKAYAAITKQKKRETMWTTRRFVKSHYIFMSLESNNMFRPTCCSQTYKASIADSLAAHWTTQLNQKHLKVKCTLNKKCRNCHLIL